LGFWLNGLHRMTDRFVDQVLFRRRHDAERRLTRFAAGLPHAGSFAMVDGALATEPAEALALESAAVLRLDDSDRFELKSSVGWPDGAMRSLGEQDPLLLYLHGAHEALRLSDVHWRRDDLPADGRGPAVAVPIVVRHQLTAIMLLGPHATGEDFDQGELHLLESCAVAAGAAYDHLEADRLRSQAKDLQRTIESLRQSLQAAGLHPAT